MEIKIDTITNKTSKSGKEFWVVEAGNDKYTVWDDGIADETKNVTTGNGECLTYVDYTLDENKQAIQDYLEKRLSDWSIVEEERQNKIIEDKTDVGVIKESKLIAVEK